MARSASTPGASVYRGHDELNEGLDAWVESWDELVIEPQEILEEGDWVFVWTEHRMSGAASGVHLEAPVAHLHELEDGPLRRWWMFGDAEKAHRFVAADRPGFAARLTAEKCVEAAEPTDWVKLSPSSAGAASRRGQLTVASE